MSKWMGAKVKTKDFLGATPTAAIVTNPNFKLSTFHSTPANNFIGLWTIWKKKQGNGGSLSELFTELRTTL